MVLFGKQNFPCCFFSATYGESAREESGVTDSPSAVAREDLAQLHLVIFFTREDQCKCKFTISAEQAAVTLVEWKGRVMTGVFYSIFPVP